MSSGSISDLPVDTVQSSAHSTLLAVTVDLRLSFLCDSGYCIIDFDLPGL